MLKRLNFLKTSLDGHSPKETTNAIRLKSVKRRDDRLYDTWKNELNQPSVQDILSSYVKKRQDQSLNLSHEGSRGPDSPD